MVENLGVFSSKLFFLIITPLKEAKKDGCSFICLALTIIDLKVVTKEFLSPANLFGAQTLYVHELAGDVIVGEYKNFMLKTL